jgi:thiamine biosynthesis protein ThiS
MADEVPPSTIRLTINGESHTLPSPITLREVCARFGVDPAVAAIERNRVIVVRSAFESTRLADGDELEIVTLVGGG